MLVAALIWGLVIPAFAVTTCVLFSRLQERRLRGIDPQTAADLRRMYGPHDAYLQRAQRLPATPQRSRGGRCGTATSGPTRNRPAVRRAHS